MPSFLRVSNLIQTPSVTRRIFLTGRLGPYLQVLVPLCTVALASARCIGGVSFILGHSKPQQNIMIFMPSRLTSDYWFEKAEQCFRRSRAGSNVRVELEAQGNVFMVNAVQLDIKLQLPKATTPPLPPRERDDYGQAAF